jgi:hypothetical protein
MEPRQRISRRRKLLAAGVVAAASLIPAAPAWAQYSGGHAPAAGSNSGPGNATQVLGETFTRTANGGFLASTGADIAELTALGAGAVAIGIVLRRRSRSA